MASATSGERLRSGQLALKQIDKVDENGFHAVTNSRSMGPTASSWCSSARRGVEVDRAVHNRRVGDDLVG